MTTLDTRPYCGQCGWTVHNIFGGDANNDLLCDSCGADLTLYGWAGFAAPTDLVAALGTDEVVFTWTEALDTSDVQYSIDGAAVVFDDDAASPYTVAAPAVASVALQVRTVLDGIPGPWSAFVTGSSGQSPPTSLTATATAGGALDVVFAFTVDPAADTTDLVYTVDAGAPVTVLDVSTGVAVVGLLGEVISGQVRSVEDGVTGLLGTAAADTIVA